MNLDRTRDTLAKELGLRGVQGLFTFLRSLKRGRYYNDISLPQLELVIHEHRLSIKKSELFLLFKELDERRRGLISVDKFIGLLKMRLSPQAQNLLQRVYKNFPRSSNTVQAHTIRQHYQPELHPDTVSAQKTSTAILVDFLDSFDAEGEVTLGDFQQYYELARLTYSSEEAFYHHLEVCWENLCTPPQSSEETELSTLLTTPHVQTQASCMSQALSPPSTPTSSIYDPSCQFSLTSPFGLGVHEEPRMDGPSYRTPTPSSSQDPSPSKPVQHLLQSYFSWNRPLPYLRERLSKDGTEWVTWDQLVLAFHELCPLYYLRLLWNHLNPSSSSSSSSTSTSTVSVSAIMNMLRQRELNPARRNIVHQAFQKFDPLKTGKVELSKLVKAYKPLVALKQKTGHHDHSIRDISRFFSEPMVTLEAFETYYADLGSSIEDDHFFVLTVWNEWQLSQPAPS
ncbi:hypothetical protein HMI56_002570 [Coelomomyces lativittatus]|nr:hypothetical protein HMI56_002570 [Coelomomyces lativittatus]